MSKRDDISFLYRLSQKISFASDTVFCLNVLAGVATTITFGTIKEVLILFQVTLVLSFFMLSIINDNLFLYNADSARRKGAIENAFNVDITGFVTDGYYNNLIQPSIVKYIVNIFESVFFSKSIVMKKLKFEFAKTFCSILILIIACIEIRNGEMLLVIMQAVFSSRFIASSIAHIFYASRLNNLYNEFYGQLVSVGLVSEKQQYRLLAIAIEYEAIKAHYKVRLQKRLFDKLNPALTVEWETILDKISYVEQNVCTSNPPINNSDYKHQI
jgi:hypothetical protein